MPHNPFAQAGVPCETTQGLPHLPQLFTSLVSVVSQMTPSASQSPRPAAQLVIPQTPALQLGVPPTDAHTLPHLPQLSVSVVTEVSQPFERSLSQSLKPASQSI